MSCGQWVTNMRCGQNAGLHELKIQVGSRNQKEASLQRYTKFSNVSQSGFLKMLNFKTFFLQSEIYLKCEIEIKSDI